MSEVTIDQILPELGKIIGDSIVEAVALKIALADTQAQLAAAEQTLELIAESNQTE
ncbi:MAG: hypothetical protein WCO52_06675 [bacterium]